MAEEMAVEKTTKPRITRSRRAGTERNGRFVLDVKSASAKLPLSAFGLIAGAVLAG